MLNTQRLLLLAWDNLGVGIIVVITTRDKHYYDEDDIDIGKPLTNCKVVVNHTIELSEAEKAEARRQAMQKATDEAYRKITQGKNKTKKTETTTQSSLF